MATVDWSRAAAGTEKDHRPLGRLNPSVPRTGGIDLDQSHHAHGSPEELICGLLLAVVKSRIEGLEHFVHCAHGV